MERTEELEELTRSGSEVQLVASKHGPVWEDAELEGNDSLDRKGSSTLVFIHSRSEKPSGVGVGLTST